MKLENLSLADLAVALDHIDKAIEKLVGKEMESLRYWQDLKWKQINLQVQIKGRVHFIEFGKAPEIHYKEFLPDNTKKQT